MSASKRLVIALGGNAILQPGQHPDYHTQKANIKSSAHLLANLIGQGYNLVVTHGNGPQIGYLLLKNERSAGQIPAMPMDVLNAQTQGFLGYLIGQALNNTLRKDGSDKSVVCLVTSVQVSKDDPGFQNPSKPVGGFFSKDVALQLKREKGWDLIEDSGRGYRRVVPSPKPLAVLEIGTIRRLLDQGISVVAGGGGGIPVILEEDYAGIEAVIDKDLTSCLLAKQLEADGLFILTDVSNVYVGYGTPSQRALETATIAEIESYIENGEFSAGSMGPKIEGAVEFVKATGNPACICALRDIEAAVSGKAGTRIVYRA